MNNIKDFVCQSITLDEELKLCGENNTALERQISILQNELNNSLPCESQYRSQLSKKLKQLKKYYSYLNKINNYHLVGYKQLSLEPFGWERSIKIDASNSFSPNKEHDIRVPLFAIVPITFPSPFKFVTRYRNRSILNNLDQFIPAEILQKYYHDFQDYIMDKKMYSTQSKSPFTDFPYEVTYEDSFVGVIPATTKDKIKAAKSFFNDHIYLVWEARWKNLEIYNPDPLIVGWDIEDKKLWLIDMFDASSVEESFASSLKEDSQLSGSLQKIFDAVEVV